MEHFSEPNNQRVCARQTFEKCEFTYDSNFMYIEKKNRENKEYS